MAAIDLLDAALDRQSLPSSLWRIDRVYPPPADRLAPTVTCGCGHRFARFRFAAASLAAGGDAVTGFAADPVRACPECGAEVSPAATGE